MLQNSGWRLSDMVKQRLLLQNKNWLCVFCGGTGSGKSYSAMTLATNIDPTFNTDKLVFKAEDFIRLLNSGKLKKGDCILFDEAGVGMPARDWYTISNKAIGYLLQTFRNLNLAVIFTVPNLNYIDGQARGLFHHYIETQKILYKEKLVHAKLFTIRVNRTGKLFFIYPKLRPKGSKKKIIIKEIYFRLPSPELINAYEKKKMAYTVQLNIGLEKAIDRMTRDAKTGRPSKLGAREIAFILGQTQRKIPQEKIVELVKEQFGTIITQGTISNVVRRAHFTSTKRTIT